MPFMLLPVDELAGMLATLGIIDDPLPQGQVIARLCAASTSRPYLASGERLFDVDAPTLGIQGQLARATLTYSSAVGARAGKRHAISADVVGGVVLVSLSETGVARIDPWRLRRWRMARQRQPPERLSKRQYARMMRGKYAHVRKKRQPARRRMLDRQKARRRATHKLARRRRRT